jgi:NPCBM/NEW2 domain-containing protein
MAAARRWAAAKFDGVLEQQPEEPGLVVIENHGPVQANGRGDEPLQVGAKVYQRGLYCHAISRIVVRLPRPGKAFTAEVGVDDRAGGGSIVFGVRVDGQEAFRSEIRRIGQAAVPVAVDLAGAREFTIEVSDAGDGISSDQADWADAGVLLDNGERLWLGDLPILTGARAPYTADPPFSFAYGGRPSAELLAKWKVERTAPAKSETSGGRVLTYTDPETGLAVRCAAVEYRDWPAVEWTLYLILEKQMVDEFHRIAECFLGDFYPLTPYTQAGDSWMVWQYDLPESGKGVVRAFRRGKCIYESARLALRGLDPDAQYTIDDLDTGEKVKATGRDLATEGLGVTIRRRPGSAVLVYHQSSAP